MTFERMEALMKILIGLCIALTWAASWAAPPLGEQQFRDQMGLDEYKEVTYQDASGASIDYQKFREIVQGGKGFSMMKNPHAGTARVQIRDRSPEPLAPPQTGELLKVKRGDPLPERSLSDLEGRVVQLQARDGRPLLLNFFFAACPPCIAEIPALNQFAKDHPQIEVLAVTFDDPATARKFIAKRGFKWPIVADGKPFFDKLGLNTYPVFAYVGKDGKLQGAAQGSTIGGQEFTADKLDAWIRKP
jgi:thiol-disulfide isomerase/thioredoxin